MCGIAGILRTGADRVDASWLERISTALQERGPDDFGFLGWKSGRDTSISRESSVADGAVCAFVHRRLSILDVTTAGWQPMQTSDGAYSLIFNGEIYNYLELRTQLEREGAVFHSGSDTEVLLAAYSRWGKDALRRLVGMFAFVILDLNRQCLFLARDPFGIKPLYYYRTATDFGFSSDPTVLLQFPGVGRSARSDRVYDYLRFGTTDFGDETLWRDIMQVPAAHFLEVPLDQRARTGAQRYWSIPKYEPRDISFEEAAVQLRELFIDSVRLHLRSDVPLGACLSGGIDSSAIVMAMRQILGASADIRSFSFIASDPRVSEERWIKTVVHESGAAPACTRPSEADLVECLTDLVRTQGEPFGSTTIFAQYAVFRLAAEHKVKVMLDGQGADEMLGGYWPYVGARIGSLLASGNVVAAMKLLRQGASYPDMKAGRLMAVAGGLVIPRGLQGLGRMLVGRKLAPDWLNADWFSRQGVVMAAPLEARGPNHLRSQLEQSVTDVTLPMLLRYEDRNSMRFSIESRVPFLTTQLAEFIFSLPEEYIIDRSAVRKSVFRRAMRGLVPNEILDRRDKIGFQTPESSWLGTLRPWIEQKLASDAAHEIPALRLPAVTREFENILQGKRASGSHAWRWINLIEWTSQYSVAFDR
jgi:asparagine synthase (glutamine-hydrolysing)